MEDKKIQIHSPAYFFALICFDVTNLFFICVLLYSYGKERKPVYIATLAILLCVEIIAAIVMLLEKKKAVVFTKDTVEFTFLDENNAYALSEIEKAETNRDTGASLKKGFVDRYSSVILYLKDGSVATVELGLTTNGKLKKIENEINKRTV